MILPQWYTAAMKLIIGAPAQFWGSDPYLKMAVADLQRLLEEESRRAAGIPNGEVKILRQADCLPARRAHEIFFEVTVTPASP